MRRLYAVALIALSAVGVLSSVSSAGAAPGDPWVYKFTFAEKDTFVRYNVIEVNHATGNVLVAASGSNFWERGIYQFDSSGNPVKFAATGTYELPVSGDLTRLIVDNSGGPTQGNIYVLHYVEGL